ALHRRHRRRRAAARDGGRVVVGRRAAARPRLARRVRRVWRARVPPHRTNARAHGGPRMTARRLARLALLPALVLLALLAWMFAAPLGSAWDDEYHLASTWCGGAGGDHCQPG